MLRFIHSARNFFFPYDTQNGKNIQVQSNTAVTAEDPMVVTRSRGAWPIPDGRTYEKERDDSPSQNSTSHSPKRKSSQLSRDGEIVDTDEEEEIMSVSKNLRVGESSERISKEDLIPTKNTRPVVEIPSRLPHTDIEDYDNEETDEVNKVDDQFMNGTLGGELQKDRSNAKIVEIPGLGGDHGQDESLDESPQTLRGYFESTRPITSVITSGILQRNTLPELLPPETFQKLYPRAKGAIELPRSRIKAKRMNLINAVIKTPKDRLIGSTTYRVSKVGNSNLPPISSLKARSTKERWLQGSSKNFTRQPFSRRFLTRK